jgi:hypothetical protein
VTNDRAFWLPRDAGAHGGKVEWFNTFINAVINHMEAPGYSCLSWNAEWLNERHANCFSCDDSTLYGGDCWLPKAMTRDCLAPCSCGNRFIKVPKHETGHAWLACTISIFPAKIGKECRGLIWLRGG